MASDYPSPRHAPQPCDRPGKANVTRLSRRPRTLLADRIAQGDPPNRRQSNDSLNHVPPDRRDRRCGAYGGDRRRPSLCQDLRFQLERLTRSSRSTSAGLARGRPQHSTGATSRSEQAPPGSRLSPSARSRPPVAARTRTSQTRPRLPASRPVDPTQPIPCSVDRTVWHAPNGASPGERKALNASADTVRPPTTIVQLTRARQRV